MRVIVMLILQNVGVNELVNGVKGDMKSARLFRFDSKKNSHSPLSLSAFDIMGEEYLLHLVTHCE